MPLLFLLFMAFAAGALCAYAGRDELRHYGEATWRTEAFLAFALFSTLVLLPTIVYFYVFHGDWFLFYGLDTGRARWLWGLITVLLWLGASLAGFHLGAGACRASRDTAARRIAIAALLFGVGVWPLAWARLSVVGSYRQFTREYGLVPYMSSAPFYSGLVMLLVGTVALAWVAIRIDRQTRDLT